MVQTIHQRAPRTWTVAGFESFWSDPQRDASVVPALISEDIVGHWSGVDEPVRGKAAYMHCIRSLIQALPGMHISVEEHATTGEFVFICWIMHAVGEHGAFELVGIDRVRTREGLVCENFVVFDTAAFVARSGKPVHWA